MTSPGPIAEHRAETKQLAKSLNWAEVYHWLLEYGYYPESYVLPPCFKVVQHPSRPKTYFKVTSKGKKFNPDRTECLSFHYPKTELTDRNFGVMHPHLHNDIAYHIARNWQSMVDAMIPRDSIVTSYSFPIPINRRKPGRLSHLRSGRMIYEFIDMTDDDLASVSYKYSHLVHTDVKNFYPSIYTHSIAWAIHGKKFIRKPENTYDCRHIGNRLDRLFQRANDNCTNGLPIGPVVSDVTAEIIASAVDRELSLGLKKRGIDCEAVRFKDDYRILVNSEGDARVVIKELQAALKVFNLQLSDEKTRVTTLPDGLFREWKSKYHAAHPTKRKCYSWTQFRELYLAVIAIDKACPGTGVIDRFLADIVSADGNIKVAVGPYNLEKVVSMLLMLTSLHVKAFPKVIAILESLVHRPSGAVLQAQVVEYLESYLVKLSVDEDRYKYLISWIGYFLVSNDLTRLLAKKPKFKDPFTRSIFNNRGAVFKGVADFKLFLGCRAAGRKTTMLKHLDVFDPPH